ncbi:unnamed protein product [Pleuronectes platessa]|uniref:Uncharacterized protein n=1 Tax=Pleuronectes platessa TaxID=8262 RepID=A0A9N7V3M4_PLEPL|nr:unnamed protein product [Pleuronectes platessa]
MGGKPCWPAHLYLMCRRMQKVVCQEAMKMNILMLSCHANISSASNFSSSTVLAVCAGHSCETTFRDMAAEAVFIENMQSTIMSWIQDIQDKGIGPKSCSVLWFR